MGRTIVVLFTLLAPAATARAQPPAMSFAELHGRLKIGETVHVTDDAGATITGSVGQVSDTTLVLETRGHERRLLALNVRRIARPVHTIRNGALIGLAAGFSIGTIAAATSKCEFACFSNPGGVLVIGGFFGSIGTAVGAAVGASFHRERVIFERATTGRAQVAIVPLVSRSGAGLRAEIDF